MSTTKRYTLPTLRRYLANKPTKTWTTGTRHCGDGPNEKHCVLGHLELLPGQERWMLSEGSPLLKPFARLSHLGGWEKTAENALATINNGDNPLYQQKTPRARVLAAIDDLIARKVPKAR